MYQKLRTLTLSFFLFAIAACSSSKRLNTVSSGDLVKNKEESITEYPAQDDDIIDNKDSLFTASQKDSEMPLNFFQANVVDIQPDINDSIAPHFVDVLDSLVYLWHVKNAFRNSPKNDSLSGNTDITLKLTDSVYIKRLEQIPTMVGLSYNNTVKNFIELYTVKRRDQVEVMLGLAEYYFPVFEEILDKEGLPLELKYLPVIESALNPRALSRAGASGLWQFMYSTGRMYQLEINSFIDERRDPIKSTYAAVKYLKDLYEIYGNWHLVIAAYNCGPGNVNKAIRRSGGRRNYWDIYYRLPRETRGYVPAYIAAVYFFNYYSEHNLIPKTTTLPIVCDTIIVNKELHFDQITQTLDISKKQLRELNPQYRADIVPATNSAYSLKLPIEHVSPFIDSQDKIFSYKRDYYFNQKDKVVNPRERYQKYAHVPPKDYAKIYYKVKQGDAVGLIASWFHVRTSNLRYWNNIRRDLIRTGQNLVIYVPKHKVAYYKKFNKMTYAQKQATLDIKTTSKPAAKSNKSGGSSDYVYYTVRRGENLWTIARKFPGISNYDIMKLNNITDARKLKPGQKLKIKKKS